MHYMHTYDLQLQCRHPPFVFIVRCGHLTAISSGRILLQMSVNHILSYRTLDVIRRLLFYSIYLNADTFSPLREIGFRVLTTSGGASPSFFLLYAFSSLIPNTNVLISQPISLLSRLRHPASQICMNSNG